MKKYFFIALVILSFQNASSQEIESKAIDSLYKEDQFYAGITYNLLSNVPSSLTQSRFSTGFHLGFIKDMPINKNRDLAIGIGLGYSANSFNQNVLVNKNTIGNFEYNIIDDTAYSKNKFSMHLIELPIEFRWRTSTATSYEFWRIYTGFKLGYVFANTTKYVSNQETIKHNNLAGFNDFQYGLTLSVGYNTWNVYLYYALNPVFTDDVIINGNKTTMNAVKIGLIFYIL